MRTVRGVLLHPLTWLAVSLGWNYRNHQTGRPTMCGTTRTVVGPVLFVACWLALSGWLLPHYCRPFRRPRP